MRIEGYFGKIKAARETVEKLKELGFKEAFIDMNDHYNENRNVQTNLPGTETSVSLSGLVLGSEAYGAVRDKAPLNAASPMVSGMGTFDEIADVNCKVVVDSGESDANKIKQIIREMGGDLESPNIRKPKIKNNAEITISNALHETQEFLDQEEKRI
ncbi:MAG: hypothetical protein QHH06_09200 [Clostridiales bacterium]|jgi:hypothetical protein|nr:hypothetical protein [Eubacteriales bacterium]MDH7566642.1 hypothetical protein [Clostridiales bacterium]